MHHPRSLLPWRMHTRACTHAQEGGEPQAVVAHGEVVWFRPDDLNDVLVELGLFPLSGGSRFTRFGFKCLGRFTSLQQSGEKQMRPLTKDALSCSKSNISFSYCSASSFPKMMASSHICGTHEDRDNSLINGWDYQTGEDDT